VCFDREDRVDAGKLQCTLKRRKNTAAQWVQGNIDPATSLPVIALQLLVCIIRTEFPAVHCYQAGADGFNEADPRIARIARKNPDSIVVSNDSDFLVFDGCSNVCRFENLDYLSSDEGFVVARVFCRRQVARALGLEEGKLVALATLVGYDRSDDVVLQKWHRKMLATMKSWKNQPLHLALHFLKSEEPGKVLGEEWDVASAESSSWYNLDEEKEAEVLNSSVEVYWFPRFGQHPSSFSLLKSFRERLEGLPRKQRGPLYYVEEIMKVKGDCEDIPNFKTAKQLFDFVLKSLQACFPLTEKEQEMLESFDSRPVFGPWTDRFQDSQLLRWTAIFDLLQSSYVLMLSAGILTQNNVEMWKPFLIAHAESILTPS